MGPWVGSLPFLDACPPWCVAGVAGAVAVSSALSVRASGYSSMAEVQLRRCGVGDEGGLAVARAVEGNKVIKVGGLVGAA